MATRGRFTDELDKKVDVRYMNNGKYLVLTAFNYRWREQNYPVPVGFPSDGFTIPKWARWILPKIPKRGLKASILHDYYVVQSQVSGFPREEADELFRSALSYLDVKTHRMCIYYKGVAGFTRLLKLTGKA